MSDAKPLTDEEIKARRQWVKDWPDSEARKLFEATYSEERADRHMVVEARYLATLAERDERIGELEAEVEESDEDDDIRMRMAKNLTSIANALRGEPPELTTWSWHDLAEVAAALAESQRLADEWYERDARWGTCVLLGRDQRAPVYKAMMGARKAYKKHRAEEGQK